MLFLIQNDIVTTQTVTFALGKTIEALFFLFGLERILTCWRDDKWLEILHTIFSLITQQHGNKFQIMNSIFYIF